MAKQQQQAAATTTAAEPTKVPETKAGRWKRLAVNRTNKALVVLRQIRNLSNKQNYEYTADGSTKIVEALSNEVDLIAKAFAGSIVPEDGFTL